jgi:hypothetical protein
VKQQIHNMVRAGVQSEKLDIEHVRQPRHRMPIREIAGRHGPFRGRERESALYFGVLVDIAGIVEAEERVMPYGGEDEHRNRRESDGDGPRHPR